MESVKIPVIANGASDEINCYDDVIKFRDDCGAASVMLARAVQRNVSIFRKEGKCNEFSLKKIGILCEITRPGLSRVAIWQHFICQREREQIGDDLFKSALKCWGL